MISYHIIIVLVTGIVLVHMWKQHKREDFYFKDTQEKKTQPSDGRCLKLAVSGEERDELAESWMRI